MGKFFKVSGQSSRCQKVLRTPNDHLTVVCRVGVQQTLWQQKKTLQQTLNESYSTPRFH